RAHPDGWAFCVFEVNLLFSCHGQHFSLLCGTPGIRGYRWLSCAESPHPVDTDNFLSFIACIILVSASVSVEAAPKDTN
ncbi:TPA: hypothetical protein ACTW4F_002858, partial [Klebsiella oxytoca]